MSRPDSKWHEKSNPYCLCETCEWDKMYLYNVQLYANYRLGNMNKQSYVSELMRMPDGEAPGALDV